MGAEGPRQLKERVLTYLQSLQRLPHIICGFFRTSTVRDAAEHP